VCAGENQLVAAGYNLGSQGPLVLLLLLLPPGGGLPHLTPQLTPPSFLSLSLSLSPPLHVGGLELCLDHSCARWLGDPLIRPLPPLSALLSFSPRAPGQGDLRCRRARLAFLARARVGWAAVSFPRLPQPRFPSSCWIWLARSDVSCPVCSKILAWVVVPGDFWEDAARPEEEGRPSSPVSSRGGCPPCFLGSKSGRSRLSVDFYCRVFGFDLLPVLSLL